MVRLTVFYLFVQDNNILLVFCYGGNMNNSKAKIGEKIRKFRVKQGMTQHDLAEKIGVTEKQISKIETGIHYPKFENFVKILESLNITLKEFANDSEQDMDVSYARKSMMKIVNRFTDKELEYLVVVAKELEKLKKKSV